ncbi:signal peptidase II [Sediminibacterium roseum]|uniref:Lipoprotein signal peptidase n=1 Tax=Sediminibacterium roseum TaxID=1978412 RepID=A0ABW9ZV79_9BACT|nr:signal peptidase II [Sediminibacterium roseum]NCI51044.1 signal peptidase II [Sediminibacterium roseum]
MSARYKIYIFFLSTILFISCDRVTKDLAKKHLMNKPTVSYFNKTVQLMYVENTGAAMSFGDGLPKTAGLWLLGILPLAFLLYLSVYILRQTEQMRAMKVFSFALIISGGLGNIIDRLLFDRHVTDFMVIGTESIRTGVFNFADVCVSAGAIGLLFFYRDKKIAKPEIPA